MAPEPRVPVLVAASAPVDGAHNGTPTEEDPSGAKRPPLELSGLTPCDIADRMKDYGFTVVFRANRDHAGDPYSSEHPGKMFALV